MTHRRQRICAILFTISFISKYTERTKTACNNSTNTFARPLEKLLRIDKQTIQVTLDMIMINVDTLSDILSLHI